MLLELCEAVDDASLAALVEGAQAPLAPWLNGPAADATPEALLLALRLWPRLPPAVAAACPLLPSGVKAKLPRGLFTDPAAASSKGAAAAAAAFFSKQHLGALLPALRATTAAHPRLHSVWPTLLSLLIPGFSADKVRAACWLQWVGRAEGGVGVGRWRALGLRRLPYRLRSAKHSAQAGLLMPPPATPDPLSLPAGAA